VVDVHVEPRLVQGGAGEECVVGVVLDQEDFQGAVQPAAKGIDLGLRFSRYRMVTQLGGTLCALAHIAASKAGDAGAC
jgi:hypothetical protein